MSKFEALQIMTPTSIHIAALLALLVIAMVIDIRSHRIPNLLVLSGLVVGLVIRAVTGLGQWQDWGLGLLAGLALLFPLYVIRVMGAGDVKLMAMVGSFVGPVGALSVVLATLVAGGLLGFLIATHKRALGQAWMNVRLLMATTAPSLPAAGRRSVQPPAGSIGNLPYAVAIALGTVCHLVLTRAGLALLG
jgi:prepilin peptidase CpaA